MMRRGIAWLSGALLLGGCVNDVDTIRDQGQPFPLGTSPTASGDDGDDGPVTGTTGEDPDQDGSDGHGVDSSTGEPPAPISCRDGLHNGDESDVDCGGDMCDPCATGQACDLSDDCWTGQCEGGACGIALSCLEIKQGRPSAQSDTYTIYPDGEDVPIDVWCDMVSYGGGWTLTFASDGNSFEVANAIPTAGPGSLPNLMENSGVRYRQYATHDEEMFVCTTGLGETPIYETRTFEYIGRLWDQSLDNAEIFLTGILGTSDASAIEFCANLVWGGCNLDHYGYAIFNAAFGSSHWGRWSANTVYGPTGSELRCFSNDDVQGSDNAWLWHFVR